MDSNSREDRIDTLATWLAANMRTLDRQHQTELGQFLISLTMKYLDASIRPGEPSARMNEPSPGATMEATKPHPQAHMGTHSARNTQAISSKARKRSSHAFIGTSDRESKQVELRAPLRQFFSIRDNGLEQHHPEALAAGRTLSAQALRVRIDAAFARMLAWAHAQSMADTRPQRGAPDDGPDDILSHVQALEMLYQRASVPAKEATSGEEMLSAQAMGDYLGTSRQTINTRYLQGTIIGLSREVGGRVYPKTQFHEDGTPRGPVWLEGLDAVVNVHGNGWAAWIWLNSPKDELDGESALDQLRSGNVHAVQAALGREQDGAFS